MSAEAVGWAFRQPVETQAERLVLLSLADSADKNTFQCWPSHRHLAEDAKCSVPTVKRALKALQERGYVRKKHRFSDNTQQSNMYELLVREGVHTEPPVHNSEPPPVHNDDPPPGSSIEPRGGSSGDLQNRSLNRIGNRGGASRRCPRGWQPREKDIAKLKSEIPQLTDEHIRQAVEKIRDHEFAKARKDWDAVFRNWIREDRDRGRIGGRHARTRNSQETVDEKRARLVGRPKPEASESRVVSTQ